MTNPKDWKNRKKRKPKIADKKRRGEWAELHFMVRAIDHDLPVSKPWGDSRTYDCVVGWPGRFVAVEGETTALGVEWGADTSSVSGARHTRQPAGAFLFLGPQGRLRLRRLCTRDHRDSRRIRCVENLFSLEEQALASVQRDARCACGLHDFDGLHSDDGDIEAHILIGLGDLYHGESAAERGGVAAERGHDVGGARDGGVGALHGFDSDAGGFGDDDGLADVVLRELAGDGAAVVDVLAFLLGGRAAGEHSGLYQQRFEQRGRTLESNAFRGANPGPGAKQAVGIARG